MYLKIKKSKFSKHLAVFLTVQLFVQMLLPMQAFALTGGPAQPEFNSFTPIGTSDMVNLSSGDFNYNIPIMDVGGYPINLAYNSGITMDQESTWVGLGWNLNVGQINRNVRGLPDDFNGDELTYETKIKPNRTTGFSVKVNPQIIGIEPSSGEQTSDTTNLGRLSLGLTTTFNNYEGISFTPSLGLSFNISDNLTVGANFSSSVAEGVSVTPNVNLSTNVFRNDKAFENGISRGLGFGVTANSRQGLSSFNMSTSVRREKGFNDKSVSSSSSGSLSFVNNTFTPVKRNAYKNTNLTFSGSVGIDIFGVDGEIGVDAFSTIQELSGSTNGYVEEQVKSFGYLNSENASVYDVLDFNKEKDNIISETTLVLPATNFTHDIYSINGQGISGSFRPFKGQLGYVYDRFVQDEGSGTSLGGEYEGGAGFHLGLDIEETISDSHTGIWDTNATSFFKPSNPASDQIDYERTYFKSIGEMRIDEEYELFNSQLGGTSPITLGIVGAPATYGKYATNSFRKKIYNVANVPSESPIAFNSKLKRTHREKRNQAIQHFTNKEIEALQNGGSGMFQLNANDFVQPHHIGAMTIGQPDGSTYVYGETVYNVAKEEVTFATEGTPDCASGIVQYQDGENTGANNAGLDNYFNKVTTPAYAHTYLLTAVLSVDYEDVTGDGPTDDDLGSYTKFTYETANDAYYKWRVPYTRNKEANILNNTASYNEGLKTEELDQKGSYIYGEKEIKYISKIETKTHVAFFHRSPRLDGYGVSNVNGDNAIPESRMYKLDKIELFSKPEYEAYQARMESGGEETTQFDLAPIKTAHFVYDYSLCKGIDNNWNEEPEGNPTDPDYYENEGGKLTLKKVYFTYRSSSMGRFVPYTFEYNTFNPDYSLKSHDIWGNYKEHAVNGCNVSDAISNQEFPFVQQFDRARQDMYASAWSLSDINLPSGGKMNIVYESDDYQYVQDRRALQMYKVVGVSETFATIQDLGNASLYNPDTFQSGEAKYLIVEIPEDVTTEEFKNNYIGQLSSKPIYFRFLTQMVRNRSEDYDYISGYLDIDTSLPFTRFNNTDDQDIERYYAAVPIKHYDLEGGVNGNKKVNPISKAAWYFGRQNLNSEVYGIEYNANEENLEDILDALGSSFGALIEIWNGPNGNLRNKQCGRLFNPEKSWIRLQHSGASKMGGGTRVAQITLDDNWEHMVQATGEEYRARYGQQYDYRGEDGRSSGVATYEPNGTKENPFVEPFFNKPERLRAPQSTNYVEKPFGESFFPASTVTYGRVTVKNIDQTLNGAPVTRHATGRVINEFYTSKDFPTKTDHTELNDNRIASNEASFAEQILNNFLNLKVETTTELTLSQGFVVRTNDMNGREKSQKVFNESGDYISGVAYRYAMNEESNELDNTLPVIDAKGRVQEKQIGVHYDVTTDFRESYSYTNILGLQGNTAGIPFIFGLILVPLALPDRAEHEKILHTTTTTKVIHTTGVMKEKIAYDLGSRVSTKNLAWDAASGQVLLTETVNEYDDNYYNFTYPAHWYYNKMDRATNNLGISGQLKAQGGEVDSESRHLFALLNGNGQQAKDVFTLGDELLITQTEELSGAVTYAERLWVVALDENVLTLMTRSGKVVNQSCATQNVIDGEVQFKIVKSGYKNLQNASMASVTSQRNPILDDNGSLKNIGPGTFITNNLIQPERARIINASAVRYSELWKPQNEFALPSLPTSVENQFDSAISTNSTLNVPPENYGFNPYVYNVLGEWKAINSYAYLTGRKADEASPRREGFFTSFHPYYTVNQGTWTIEDDAVASSADRWTFASQVSKVSPFGAELENRDALNRYSSAQYGYNYTLPTAVSSNSKYSQMGFDGFEDYLYQGNLGNGKAHFAVGPAQFADPSEASNFPVSISNARAHSGRYSLKVESEATYSVKLSKEVPDVIQPKCETVTCPDGCVLLDDGSCDCPPDGDCPTIFQSDDVAPNSTSTTFTFEQVFLTNDVQVDNFTLNDSDCSDGNACCTSPILIINNQQKLITLEHCIRDLNDDTMWRHRYFLDYSGSGCNERLEFTVAEQL